ncbi:hypothetical protein NVV30_19130 [Pseudomonas syringae]|uniref:hypothetical protein n=1 Tax=Pseudomonas syringae TaxID=317 RepID=UPI00215B0B66|nr:hypothetical protein [Pseudomonas syringae]MCR8720797.1 hypothetical protein [Pseudomonas syringae]
MYRKAIVTFLDILGFRSLIKDESSEAIDSILDKMSKYAAPIADPDDYSYHPITTTFSDCVMRVSFTDSKANSDYQIGLLFYELLALVHAQSELIDNDVIVRGGVAFGDISYKNHRIFVPAMVDAYELESKKAVFPRIVINPIWMEALKSDRFIRSKNHTLKEELNHIRKLIRKDDDGVYFIDYIRAIRSELDDPEAGYISFLKRHCSLIKRNLDKHTDQGKVLDKYKWLSRYHDELINELAEDFLKYYGHSKESLLTGGQNNL